MCTNAAVHVGYDTGATVFDLLAAYDIQLLFLPTYSPELNPCDLVFFLIKAELGKLKKSGLTFWLVTICCTSHVTMSLLFEVCNCMKFLMVGINVFLPG